MITLNTKENTNKGWMNVDIREGILATPYKAANNNKEQILYVCDLYGQYLNNIINRHAITNEEKAIKNYIEELLLIAAKDGNINIIYQDPYRDNAQALKEIIEYKVKEKGLAEPKVLNCSSQGDKRFSALYAKVECFGVLDTIEHHYQNVKRNEKNEKVGKGKPVDHISLNIPRDGMYHSVTFNSVYLTPFYKMLWCKYLDQHPELVEYASTFDEFYDPFIGKHQRNSQADVIRQYVKEGRASVIQDIKEFNRLLKKAMAKEVQKETAVTVQSNIAVYESKQPIDYSKENDRVYYGCVGNYAMWPITEKQIELIQKLVTNYKLSVHCCETRNDATRTIHAIYDKIHKKEVKLRKNPNAGHVEVIDDRYVFVQDGGVR